MDHMENDTLKRPKKPKTVPLYLRIEEWDITPRFGIKKVVNPQTPPIFHDVCGLDVENDENTGAFLLLGIFDGTTYYGWTKFEMAKMVYIPQFSGHNGISDLEKMKVWGFKVADTSLVWDSQLYQHIQDSSQRTYSLKDVSKRELNYEFPSYEDICGKKTNKSHKPFTQQPIELVISKNASDCYATYHLMKKQRARSTAQQQMYYQSVESSVSKVFHAMSEKGIRIDVPYLKQLEQELSGKRDVLEKEIKNELGNINLNSTPQLLKALALKNIYPVGVKGKNRGKPSADKFALEKYKDIYFVNKLRERNELETLISSFISPYIGRNIEITHPNFLQTGTRTGRPSCSNPNLLQIPRREEERFYDGKLVRRMFIPREGMQFGELDYGQIEPRLLAHLSKDSSMCEMFSSGTDFHNYTAERLGIGREAAKVLNLSVGYRATFKSVSQQLKCSEQEAQKQIDAWWSAFPQLYAWQTKLIWQAKKDGYFTTLMGRRINVDGLNEYNKWKREHAERQLINNIAQASATEVMKHVMIQAHKHNINILVQVYDSLLIEEPKDEIEAQIEKAADIMKHAVKLDVPLTVDYGIGSSWADVK